MCNRNSLNLLGDSHNYPSILVLELLEKIFHRQTIINCEMANALQFQDLIFSDSMFKRVPHRKMFHYSWNQISISNIYNKIETNFYFFSSSLLALQGFTILFIQTFSELLVFEALELIYLWSMIFFSLILIWVGFLGVRFAVGCGE